MVTNISDINISINKYNYNETFHSARVRVTTYSQPSLCHLSQGQSTVKHSESQLN
jgi:hypothetical protein